ncbi:MAG TPA: hypothetical protein VIJ10_07560 [Vicinamibacteria bacterium]|jgi:hypothetical protein
MRDNLRSFALAALLCQGSVAATAWDGPPPPTGQMDVVAAGEPLTLWPYTTADFESPSDPVNLIFPNADPRGIRQELVKLDGARPPFATLPGGNCTWTDAMGNEHAAWGEPAGWVGGAVQLACVQPGAPLGSPFRFHVRLFRSGAHTLGSAHFEFLIPGTAEHEVLSWDLAREFVTFDVARTGVLTAAPTAIGLIPAGAFRTVRRPVYLGLVQAGAAPLLASLGLVLPPSGDVPIPTSGQARVLAAAVDFEPLRSEARTTTRVTYSIVVPRPFCATGPGDFVKLEGPLDFAMTVHTSRSGNYERHYLVGGTLVVTPMTPTSATTFVPVGDPVDAIVFEAHRGTLTDRRGQVTELAAQILLGDPKQSLSRRFSAGHADHFASTVLCGTE